MAGADNARKQTQGHPRTAQARHQGKAYEPEIVLANETGDYAHTVHFNKMLGRDTLICRLKTFQASCSRQRLILRK